MENRIVTFGYENSELYKIALNIRHSVFIEEQHVDQNIEVDEYEKQCVHYLVWADHRPVGTARWRLTETGIKLERFAVYTEFRGYELGKVLLEKMLQDTVLLGRPIYLHAQLSAMSFYERNGFTKTGNIFQEADIPHYKMNYTQTV